jgi:serine/threonine protein kinase
LPSAPARSHTHTQTLTHTNTLSHSRSHKPRYSLAFGKTPFQHLNPLQKLQAIVSPDYSIEYPKTKNRALIDVLHSCLQRDPKKRPTITELLCHKFLNPHSTASATPIKGQTTSGGNMSISEEQLRMLLMEHGMLGSASPGALRRRLQELESTSTQRGGGGGGGGHRVPSLASEFKAASIAPQQQQQQQQQQRPKGQSSVSALAQLDPNALSRVRQSLKSVDRKLARAPLPSAAAAAPKVDLQSMILKGVQKKFGNSAPADQDTAALETSEWRTMEVE